MSMRQGGQNRRSRNGRSNGKRPFSSHGGGGGGGGGGQGGGLNRSFESNGPGVKLRGTAAQVYDKYLALARDASSAGDRVAAENYFQHAEHYFRLNGIFLERQRLQQAQNPQQNQQPQQGGQQGQGQGGQGGGGRQGGFEGDEDEEEAQMERTGGDHNQNNDEDAEEPDRAA